MRKSSEVLTATRKTKLRICYAANAVILFTVEVCIALFVHDTVIRPYFGDVLVVIFIYCVVRVAIPDKPRLLSPYVFAFAVLVEISQYFEFVRLLGLQDNIFARVVLGTSFSWIDILCYAIGCIPLLAWERVNRHV